MREMAFRCMLIFVDYDWKRLDYGHTKLKEIGVNTDYT